jgi:hypothetical protein
MDLHLHRILHVLQIERVLVLLARDGELARDELARDSELPI